jgi:hypothetical protein
LLKALLLSGRPADANAIVNEVELNLSACVKPKLFSDFEWNGHLTFACEAHWYYSYGKSNTLRRARK